MAIVDGAIEVVVSREKLLHVGRPSGMGVEFTAETLADATCTAFCGPKGLAPKGGLQLEIHRRQHLEIAKSIIEAKGA